MSRGKNESVTPADSGYPILQENAWQSVEFHLIKYANRLKGQICKKPPPLFSEFYGIFLATFNLCILCHMKISYLMIKSVDCYNFPRSSGCRCSIAFLRI